MRRKIIIIIKALLVIIAKILVDEAIACAVRRGPADTRAGGRGQPIGARITAARGAGHNLIDCYVTNNIIIMRIGCTAPDRSSVFFTWTSLSARKSYVQHKTTLCDILHFE